MKASIDRGIARWARRLILVEGNDVRKLTEEEVRVMAGGRPGVGPRAQGRTAKQKSAESRSMSWLEQELTCRGDTWDEVEVRVARLLRLRARSPNRFLILALAHPHRFVQFAAGGAKGGVRAEAISNYFLKGEVQRRRQLARERIVRRGGSRALPRSLKTKGVLLSRTELAALGDLGWREPNGRQPNFWRKWPRGADHEQAAGLAVSTLRDAFGIKTPRNLTITCGSF